MSIYTRTGDQGTTALVGGSRVHKYDLRVEAYGTVDELNAAISLAAKAVTLPEQQQFLQQLQHQLFYLGAELADPRTEPQPNRIYVETADITAMETLIDQSLAPLPPVHSFILPGTSEAGSRLHLARTITRRAERRVAELASQEPVRATVLQFLNRLSDCLYALARAADWQAETETVIEQVIHRYLAATQGKPATQGDLPIMNNTELRTTTSTELGLPLLQKILQQAIQEADTIHVPMVIAVVDKHGNPVLTYRMPDSLLVSIELAPKKAYTAAALKCPTNELSAGVQPGADLFQLEASSGGKVVSFGGGYPLYHDGNIIGALGVSGGTVAEDMRVAQAALRGLHLGKNL